MSKQLKIFIKLKAQEIGCYLGCLLLVGVVFGTLIGFLWLCNRYWSMGWCFAILIGLFILLAPFAEMQKTPAQWIRDNWRQAGWLAKEDDKPSRNT